MLRLYRHDPKLNKGEWLSKEVLASDGDTMRASESVLWIDLEQPTEEEEKLVLERFFSIHPLSFEDVTHLKRLPDVPPHFPKVEEFPDYLFVIVNPLAQRLIENIARVGEEGSEVLFEGAFPITQLSAVFTERILITHHYEPVRGITDLVSHLEKHPKTAERGPDYLFHLILDEMVDEYAPVLDHFGEMMENYETQLFTNPTRTMLTRLIDNKRAVIVLRKTLIHEREILARLARGEFALINEREGVYYRNVYDHLIRFSELIEGVREAISDLLQLHLAAQSNRLNEIMKVLTMISTIILPMTLIAGIYGMNFENMELFPPTQDEKGGQWLSYIVMLVAGLVPLALFRLKKWI